MLLCNTVNDFPREEGTVSFVKYCVSDDMFVEIAIQGEMHECLWFRGFF